MNHPEIFQPLRKIFLLVIILFAINSLWCSIELQAQSAMINVDARTRTSLNGEWEAIIDPTGIGEWRKVWEERKPQSKTDFVEYSFEGGPKFHVPGDFNSQMAELFYVEGVVWYKKTFTVKKKDNQRIFIHFGAVNYMAEVYLNGKHLGSHEGGFTPFQFELTKDIREGENTIVVKVNSQRRKDGLPGLGYDWFNYGGITRDVNLVTTADTFIEDYFIQLKKNSGSEVLGWVKLNGNKLSQNIRVRIPELKLDQPSKSDSKGFAEIRLNNSKLQLWSPENPKLYKVIIQTESDTIEDEIGFRNIQVKGTQIFLNGKPVFFKGVNIHEERAQKGGRAYTKEDAMVLLSYAKELGCNLVRLSHYPHNEHMVKLAEKMGLMVWDELPAYQHIEFASPDMPAKLELMMKEMIRRDRNRCGVTIWSLSNETYPTTPDRNKVLIELSKKCRLEDSTRLITSVMNTQGYSNHTINVWDTLYKHFDVMSINEYLGWYVPWQGKPSATKWKLVYQKPIIISEFGGEAKYGSNYGPGDEAANWNEEYQEQIYIDQIEMFSTTPNLVGVCPWLLMDYRSSGRMHPVYQNGYNRKGVMSEYGEKKKAWYVLRKYFLSR